MKSISLSEGRRNEVPRTNNWRLGLQRDSHFGVERPQNRWGSWIRDDPSCVASDLGWFDRIGDNADLKTFFVLHSYFSGCQGVSITR